MLEELDVSLLRALQALLNTVSVSGAAVRLGQQQPAMSRKLGVLRRLTGDQLLVRVGNQMQLTPRAEVLRPVVDRVLAELAQLSPHQGFLPAQMQRQFTIACYDFLPVERFADLVGELVLASPASSFVIQGIADKNDFVRRMCDGELDAAITSRMDIPGVLRSSRLLSDPLAAVVRPDHALAAGMDLAVYGQARHISALERARGAGAAVDVLLAAAGVRHEVAIRTQYLSLVPAMVARTGMVFTTGLRHAQRMAADHGLVCVPMPTEIGSIVSYLVWHERTHLEPAARWLREQLTLRLRSI